MSARVAHVPTRTCVGCRGSDVRSELLRLAVDADGGFVADPRGTMPGRGAYVHREATCVDLALAKGGAAVARALRRRADREATARLRRNIEEELR